MFSFSPFIRKLRRNLQNYSHLSNTLHFHSLFREPMLTCECTTTTLPQSNSLFRYSIQNTNIFFDRQMSSNASIQLETDGAVVRFSFGNEPHKGGGTDRDVEIFRKETANGGRTERDVVRYRKETEIGGGSARHIVKFRKESEIGGGTDRGVVRIRKEIERGRQRDRDVVKFRKDTGRGRGTDRGVVIFRKGTGRGRGAQGIVNKSKRKVTRKSKLKELRFYRLKAKKKMRSPNPAVRIRYKLGKAKRKEEWLIQKLRKYEIPRGAVEKHDPEILTEEERFYMKRIGWKKKHYVPVGRRGVFGNVVLNMHQHWKRHETVIVSCRPCKPGQIHDYAAELARLSNGIIMDIRPDNTVLFYRGKNYVLPEVMSPPNTLPKAMAMEKYKFEQSLDHMSQFIERLEKELEEYQSHLERYKLNKKNERPNSGVDG